MKKLLTLSLVIVMLLSCFVTAQADVYEQTFWDDAKHSSRQKLGGMMLGLYTG